MTKYNLAAIMTRAWEIKRQDSRNVFGLCLKMAWAEAKETAQKFENGMQIVVTVGTVDYNLTLNRWTKYGKDRVYINDGTRNGAGFVDLVTGKTYLRGNCKYQTIAADMIKAMAF